MSARCTLVLNGKPVRVATGDTPVEDAVAQGVIAYGQAMHGTKMLGQAAGAHARRAIRPGARAESVELAPLPEMPVLTATNEAAPKPQTHTGFVSEVVALGRTVLQVVITTARNLELAPGHQAILAVEGFEPFVTCPTLKIDGSTELNECVLHLSGDENDGAAALVQALREGDLTGRPAKLRAPFGRTAYRPGGGRLVLVAGETGFASIWAIARAARYVEPAREIALIVGARDPLDIYMRPALEWLRATGVDRITLAADRSRQRPPDVRPGPLTAHVPTLRTNDIVYVSGDSSTVGAVEVLAASVGARCTQIPLDPAS